MKLKRLGDRVNTYLDMIIRAFHRTARPMYLGEISLDLKLSLDYAEALVEELVFREVIRPATVEEITKLEARSGSSIYILIGKPTQKLAHAP